MSFFFIIIIITEPRQHGSVAAWELFVIGTGHISLFTLVFSSNTSKLEKKKWKENFINHDK